MHDGKTSAMAKFQNLTGKLIFVFQEKFLRVMYQIAFIFAEETELSKKPNVSQGSSGVIFIIY